MDPIDVAYVGGVCAPALVIFDLCHAPPTLILAHPNPNLSVNELVDPGAIIYRGLCPGRGKPVCL